MSKYQTPYRYDFVGSFLRPQEVKQAKADYSEGKITKEECDAIVDKAVTEVVAKQKELGFHIITDGEFRRTYWHLDFMWGFEGVGHEQTGAGVQFNAEMAAVEDTYLTGKVKAKAHPFVEGFKFLKQFEDENTVAKYTIPAPAQMFQQMIVPANFENTRKYYATNEELIQDIGKAYQEVIRQFYEAGCSNLQLDDCTWGAIVGDAAKQRYERLGLDLNKVKAQLLEVNNLALEGKPEDMVITSHICRGNYHSTFFTSGPYDSVADYVFAKENVDALFLEYDDARSGGFAPLAKVSEDKKVVLGLITTKSPELEDKETVIKRIYEAAKYIPLERLCLSPQCGFASCEIGNKLTEEEHDGKEHAVQRNAQGADRTQRQQVAGNDAQCRAGCPRRGCQQDGTVSIAGVQAAGPCNGDAEQLVRYVVTDDQPMPEGCTRRKPLSQRAAHEQIACIGDEGDHGHLKIAGTAHNKRKGSVFTGRCVVQQTGQKPLKRGKTRLVNISSISLKKSFLLFSPLKISLNILPSFKNKIRSQKDALNGSCVTKR